MFGVRRSSFGVRRLTFSVRGSAFGVRRPEFSGRRAQLCFCNIEQTGTIRLKRPNVKKHRTLNGER
jgi:hypothetical protein